MARRRVVRWRDTLVAAASAVIAAGTAVLIVGSGWTAPTGTGSPSVSGSTSVGGQLSCDVGTWDPPGDQPTSYTITWQTSPSWSSVGTGSPYTVGSGDAGKQLRCAVVATNPNGSSSAAVSTASSSIPGSADPNLILTDTFTEADGTNLTAHTGEVGATWTKHPVSSQDIVIDAGRAHAAGSSTLSRYIASVTPSSPDYDVDANLAYVSTVTNDIVTIWGRLNATTDDGYGCRYDRGLGAFRLLKVVSGTVSTLGTNYSDTFTSGARAVKLELRGTSIKCYVDGTQRISATDSAISAAGRIGVGIRNSTATTGIHLDSIFATLASGAPASTVAPAVTGTTQATSTLSCSTGTWSNAPTSYSYQWQRDSGSGFGSIGSATNSTYVLVTGDVGASVRCQVTATNGTGSATTNSNSVGPISAAPPPPGSPPANTAVPAVTGTAQEGSVLSCSTGTWTNTPTSYAYKWQGNGSDIFAATSSTYTLVTADVGTNVRCVVTATNANGSASANATAVGPITSAPLPPPPAPSGTGNVWVRMGGSDTGVQCARFVNPVTDPGGGCATWAKAYQLARTGDTILVTCGGPAACTFGDQALAPNSNLTNYVTFKPQVGVDPQLGCYTTLANNGFVYTINAPTMDVASTTCWTGGTNPMTPPYRLYENVGEGNPTSCTGVSGNTFTGCGGGIGSIGTGNSFEYPLTVYRAGRLQASNGVTWVKFDGFKVSEFDTTGSTTNHITFTNGRMNIWAISSANDINVTYSTIGPFSNGRANAGPSHNATNITFDHDVFTDWNGDGVKTGYTNYHGESFYIGYGTGLTITNNIFSNYAEYAIYFSPGQEASIAQGGANRAWMYDNVLIRNNFFGQASTKFGASASIDNYDGTNLSNWGTALGVRNWTIEYNTFAYIGSLTNVNYPGGKSNVVVRANYGIPVSSCNWGTSFVDNVWVTGACSGDRPTAPLQVVNNSLLNFDLHLTSTSNARGQGDPASCPLTDWDGDLRPDPPASTCDAGADEVP